jgi:hypothetical protein
VYNRDVLRTLVEHPALLKRIETDYKENVRKSSQTASIKKLTYFRGRKLQPGLELIMTCRSTDDTADDAANQLTRHTEIAAIAPSAAGVA